jgi:hypothetical protein
MSGQRRPLVEQLNSPATRSWFAVHILRNGGSTDEALAHEGLANCNLTIGYTICSSVARSNAPGA